MATKRLVKITRTRVVAAGATGLAGAIAATAFFLLTDSKELRYPTQTALRNALAANATEELRGRGIALGSALQCTDIEGWTKLRLRAGCKGKTADRRDVQVIGTGEDKTKTHHFTILIDGRPVVENARCLGADCRSETG